MHYMSTMLVGSQRVQLRKLKNGEITDPKELKRIRYNLRSYVARMLRDIPELLEVIDALGEDQVHQLVEKGDISTDGLTAACRLTETIAQKLDVAPIVYNAAHTAGPTCFKTAIIKTQKGLDFMTMYRPAAPEDITRWETIKEHVVNVEHHINPYVRDPVVRDTEYAKRFEAPKGEWEPGSGGAWHFYGRRNSEGRILDSLMNDPGLLSESDFSRYVNPPGLPPRPEE